MRLQRDGHMYHADKAYRDHDEQAKIENRREALELRSTLVDELYCSPYDQSKAFGRLIYIARNQANMTQEQLAKETGIPYTEILGYESGMRVPIQKSVVHKFCKALGIDTVLAMKERDTAALAIRHLCVLEKRGGNSRIMNRIDVFLPARITQWLKAEGALRGLRMSGFAALLISMNYRLELRKLTDPFDELEAEFEYSDDPAISTPEKVLIYDEDADKEYFQSPDSTYEFAPESE